MGKAIETAMTDHERDVGSALLLFNAGRTAKAGGHSSSARVRRRLPNEGKTSQPCKPARPAALARAPTPSGPI